MTPDQYQELAEFVARKFDQMKEETRAIVAVGVGSLRDDLRAVAEQVTANGWTA